MKKKPTHAEVDAILGGTRAKFDAILAMADEPLPTLFEEIDVEAMTRSAGLDIPIDFSDLDALLAKPRQPERPAAATTPAAAYSAPPGSVKISIRIPGRILAAFKTRAAATGRPYQKLLNQVLRDAVRGWETPVGTAGHV